ncbi:urease accessory protein UreF [Dictyobacter alpinus]|uniref:Urease accessory protein UreF n=1 Tax=Dictyobacter alpinus TaxID=2014873 RepID=A0A402BI81_9CHLR|nr:urease accessory UreF family protein [Dictyobacter alpinus]GCE30957.1 urease accessory protein UreF [Dictyobacter alpinus]
MHIDTLSFLKLLQLADSALPIGSTAHSFGLETLTVEDDLSVTQLESFFQQFLLETGQLESSFCRFSYRLAQLPDTDQLTLKWSTLNMHLSAFKTARESRIASATLGRRFLQLVLSLEDNALLRQILQTAKIQQTDIHYSTAFGLVSAISGIDETTTVLAYLQQSLTGFISACQRLLPLGQSQASGILWRLKPILIDVSQRSLDTSEQLEELTVFTPLLDIGSMRHPLVTTRLFIS